MLRNWQLIITLERKGELALHLQIVQAIVQEIRRGRLVAGDALPGSRALANALSINRKTAVQAYEELLAQGWIETRPRKGAFVSAALPNVSHSLNPPSEKPLAAPLTSRSALNADEDKPLLQFSDGVPDTRLVPFNAISRAFRHAIVSSSRANQLAYGDPRGSARLRAAVAQMLRAERGMAVADEQVCIVRGSQMGIYLSAQLLAGSGRSIALETLSYPPAREAFRACGLTVIDVQQDAQGMDLDHLEKLCQQHRLGAVYTTPHHQFPTTVMLPVERRMRLLELSTKYGFTIIEDDYDHEFHFSHSPMLPLASAQAAENVIHIGSLSKVLAPGLRVGYLVAPRPIVDRCAEQIMLIDRQGNAITELAVEELMRDGEVKRHIRRALKIYQARRDHAVSQVAKHLPQAEFTVPPGGLALWLRFPPATPMREIEARAQHAGLGILPGYRFSGRGEDIPALRLGYASMNSGEFDHAIVLLAKAFDRE